MKLNIILSFIGLFLNYFSLHGQAEIESSILQRLESEDSVDCFLIFKSQAEIPSLAAHFTKEEKAQLIFQALNQTATQTQAPIIEKLDQWQIQYKRFYIVNAIRIKADKQRITQLAQEPSIEEILPDFPMKQSKLRPNPFTVRQQENYFNWAIEKVRADSVWRTGIRGKGILVGGQDTGYDWDHYLLKNQYKGYSPTDGIDHNYHWYDAINGPNALHEDSLALPLNARCGYNSPEPCDDHGHGSHTMGIVLGGDGINFSGMAPQAQWIGARIMDRGYGQLSTYLSGLQWFLAPTDLQGQNPKPEKAPHVIVNSWSCPEEEGCNDTNTWMLDTAITRLTQSGIFVVVSAGNEGHLYSCTSLRSAPAIFKNSFTVGASDQNDSITFFSSRREDFTYGVKPEVVAPGLDIRSAFYDDRLTNFSGTSMSGPVVAGIVALVLEANPNLIGQVDQIRKVLIQSTIPIFEHECGETGSPNSTYGYGRIDALLAVENAQKILTANQHRPKDIRIKMYPNPTQNELRISFDQNQALVTIEIYNLNGQQMMSEKYINTQSPKLSVQNLQNGMYFARIIQGSNWSVHKFIKQ